MEVNNHNSSKGKVIASGIIPFAFVILMMVYIFGPGADLLDFGTPLPEVTIEKVDFVDSEIQATVRNTGPIAVEVVITSVVPKPPSIVLYSLSIQTSLVGFILMLPRQVTTSKGLIFTALLANGCLKSSTSE